LLPSWGRSALACNRSSALAQRHCQPSAPRGERLDEPRRRTNGYSIAAVPVMIDVDLRRMMDEDDAS
jgi:hypothetical protein